MDKELAFGWTILPAQIQVVNGLFILVMVPIFTFGIYPLLNRFFTLTPLRKIGIGLFVIAASFVLVAWIEARIQSGHGVSAWWQILAYAILTASEVLVSITALEFSYKQAPLKMKSFIMALFLFSTSVGNLMTAGVNSVMVRPLAASNIETGAQTWVELDEVTPFVVGQKIDFDGDNGVQVVTAQGAQALSGTFLVAAIDTAAKRVQLMDVIKRMPVASSGAFKPAQSEVSTYALVGPYYFLFFAAAAGGVACVFVFVAMAYKEKVYVRESALAADAP
jgi:POT family proton-dependent oligopeptide transporter